MLNHVKDASPSHIAPMTPIQATHPLQFVTMDYLTVEKAMGCENHLGNHRSFYQICPGIPNQESKGNNNSQVCTRLYLTIWLPREISLRSRTNLCG